MNSDVRDILEINQPSPVSKISKKKKIKRIIEPIKRPQGVHREVWGLICKDDRDQAPIIPAEEPKAIYQHPKAKLRYGVRKWHFIEFNNPARTDNAKFSHWRCVNDDQTKEYPFAKFNKKIKVVTYTDQEYNQYLNGDEAWTKTETDHLMELCKKYDLRFFIIHDRWDPSIFPSAKNRTIDELKDRYYKVTGIVQKVKFGEDSQTYVFDLEHEQKRREQLEKLFNRTKEQVEEETHLIEELKKIEVRKKERERKQQDVNKLLTAVVDYENTAQQQAKLINKQRGSIENRSSIGGSNSQTLNNTASNKRVKQRKYSTHSNSDIKGQGPGGQKAAGSGNNSGNNSLNNSTDTTNLSPSTGSQHDSKNNRKSLIFKAVVDSTGIKFPDAKLAGVTLRSFKMKLPPSVGTKKTKAIEQLLDELAIEHRPIATESVCEQFNELRSDIVLLYELQQALTNCDYEFQTFKHRYESIAPGKNVEFGTLDSSLSSSTSSLFPAMSSSNTPQKRISEIFDVTVTPTGSLDRRRKAALNQTNILKRLRGRNAS